MLKKEKSSSLINSKTKFNFSLSRPNSSIKGKNYYLKTNTNSSSSHSKHPPPIIFTVTKKTSNNIFDNKAEKDELYKNNIKLKRSISKMKKRLTYTKFQVVKKGIEIQEKEKLILDCLKENDIEIDHKANLEKAKESAMVSLYKDKYISLKEKYEEQLNQNKILKANIVNTKIKEYQIENDILNKEISRIKLLYEESQKNVAKLQKTIDELNKIKDKFNEKNKNKEKLKLFIGNLKINDIKFLNTKKTKENTLLKSNESVKKIKELKKELSDIKLAYTRKNMDYLELKKVYDNYQKKINNSSNNILKSNNINDLSDIKIPDNKDKKELYKNLYDESQNKILTYEKYLKEKNINPEDILKNSDFDFNGIFSKEKKFPLSYMKNNSTPIIINEDKDKNEHMIFSNLRPYNINEKKENNKKDINIKNKDIISSNNNPIYEDDIITPDNNINNDENNFEININKNKKEEIKKDEENISNEINDIKLENNNRYKDYNIEESNNKIIEDNDKNINNTNKDNLKENNNNSPKEENLDNNNSINNDFKDNNNKEEEKNINEDNNNIINKDNKDEEKNKLNDDDNSSKNDNFKGNINEVKNNNNIIQEDEKNISNDKKDDMKKNPSVVNEENLKINEHSPSNTNKNISNYSNSEKKIEEKNQENENKFLPIIHTFLKNFEANDITTDFLEDKLKVILESFEGTEELKIDDFLSPFIALFIESMKITKESDIEEIKKFFNEYINYLKGNTSEFFNDLLKIFQNINNYTPLENKENVINTLAFNLQKYQPDLGNIIKQNCTITDNDLHLLTFDKFRKIVKDLNIKLSDENMEFLLYKMKKNTPQNSSIFDLSGDYILKLLEKELSENIINNEDLGVIISNKLSDFKNNMLDENTDLEEVFKDKIKKIKSDEKSFEVVEKDVFFEMMEKFGVTVTEELKDVIYHVFINEEPICTNNGENKMMDFSKLRNLFLTDYYSE